MPLIQMADGPDAIQRRLFTDPTPQGIRCIGRVDDHGAFTHRLSGTANQTGLRRLRMNMQNLAHATSLSPITDSVTGLSSLFLLASSCFSGSATLALSLLKR